MGNLLGLANPMANNFINLNGNNFIGSRQRPDVFGEPVAQPVAQPVALMMLQQLLANNRNLTSRIAPYSEQEQSNPICEEEDSSITSMFTGNQLDDELEYNSTTSDFMANNRELEGGGKKKKTPVKSSSTRSRTSSNSRPKTSIRKNSGKNKKEQKEQKNKNKDKEDDESSSSSSSNSSSESSSSSNSSSSSLSDSIYNTSNETRSKKQSDMDDQSGGESHSYISSSAHTDNDSVLSSNISINKKNKKSHYLPDSINTSDINMISVEE